MGDVGDIGGFHQTGAVQDMLNDTSDNHIEQHRNINPLVRAPMLNLSLFSLP
jgi:hypothetical protein